MAVETLEHILDEIKTLEPQELQEVERVVRRLLEPTSKEGEREAILRVLQLSGRVKEIKRPPMDVARKRHMATIQGKPISETIIEERR